MYSCIVFLLTEGTARILLYSRNTEMSIGVRMASLNQKNVLIFCVIVRQLYDTCHCGVLLCSDDDVENESMHQVTEADEEDDGEREAKWRTERLEREKFLEEHKVGTRMHALHCCRFCFIHYSSSAVQPF